MEVVVKLEGNKPDSTELETLMLGRFAMVCRDTKTHKAKRVPPLEIDSGEERTLWAIGDGKLLLSVVWCSLTCVICFAEHQKRRKATALTALDKVPVCT